MIFIITTPNMQDQQTGDHGIAFGSLKRRAIGDRRIELQDRRNDIAIGVKRAFYER